MKLTKTEFKGLFIIETDVFGDHRGWFTETYTKNKFENFGINHNFIQDNQSYSSQKDTLRGLHFQNNPMAQTKMIRCTRGKILDVVVDLRRGSDTYLKSFAIELSAENKKQFLIPKGFAHSFVTLTYDAEVQYKVDQYYSKEHDRSINYADKDLNIKWPIENPILSEKDLSAPMLKESDYNFSIKVLVTGVNGQLGYDVVKQLKNMHIDYRGVDIVDFDLTKQDEVERYVKNYKPDVIVHCAAYTAVDKAENNKDLCKDINVNGTKYLANVAKDIDAKFIYISTDYVFDGNGTQPHSEGEIKNPINIYGLSKSLGEDIIIELLDKFFIVRTSWVYGINGHNFVKTMLKLAQTKNELSIVSDQIGSPTYTVDLAAFIIELMQTTKYGIYHGTNEGYCSWAEFAFKIFEKSNRTVNVIGIKTSQYPTPAKRPLNSRLSKTNTINNGFSLMPHWENALDRFLREMEQGDKL